MGGHRVLPRVTSSDGFADHRLEGAAVMTPLVVSRVVYGGWILAALGGGGLLVLHLVNAFTLDHPLLDANREGTVWTWASVGATFTVAVGAGLRFIGVSTERGRYGALALAAAFLSLDDLTALHERLAGLAVRILRLSDAWDSVLWPAFYAPLMLAIVLILERVTRNRPAGIRWQAGVGVALLGAAVALEVVSAPWSTTGWSLVHTIEGGFEEAAEQAGWTLLASAVMAAALCDLSAAGCDRR